MNRFSRIHPGAVALVLLLLLAGMWQPLFAAELPAGSYYHLDAPLETHRGNEMNFASLEGTPVIVSMFYGSCPHVCPMLINTIQQIESQLPQEVIKNLRVVMVSVDPERDTPEHLAAVAEQHGVDSERWILARTASDRTRPLAAVLGIKYKALPGGDFNHTSAIILLDARGVEVARSGKLGIPDPAFVQRVNIALQSPQP